MMNIAKFPQARAWSILIGIFCCLLGVGLSQGARPAHAVAYGRVDVDINNLLVSGSAAQGTTIVVAGSNTTLNFTNDASLETALSFTGASTSDITVGDAPEAFVGNIV